MLITNSVTTLTSGVGSKEFTHEQLDKALFNVEDIFGRAMCPFLLLGQTAKDVVEELYLSGNHVEVGVEERYLTKGVRSTLKTYIKNIEFKDEGFVYEVEGVPVKVKFIKKRYPFFKYPDSYFYLAGDYKLPNPFESYWKARFLIR